MKLLLALGLLLPIPALSLGAIQPTAFAQAAASSPGSPVCATTASTTAAACVLTGSGNVTLPPGGFAYLTASPQAPQLHPSTAPPDTLLQVFAQGGGTVTVDSSSVTLGVPAGMAIELLQANDRPLTDCAPVDEQVNTLRCRLPSGDTTAAFPKVSFWVGGATSSPQRLILDGHATDLLIAPADPVDPLAAPRLLTVIEPGDDDGHTILYWDGAQVVITATDGNAISVSPQDGCQSGAPVPSGIPASGTIYGTSAGSFSQHILYPPSTVVCDSVTGGTITVVITAPPTVFIPGTVTLPPGGAVHFDRPVAPKPANSPPPSYFFGPVLIVSGSDQPLSLGYDGKVLSIIAPDGLAIQLVSPSPPGGFQNCSETAGEPNDVDCEVSMPPLMQNTLMVMTMPAGDTSPISVPPHSMAAIIGAQSFITRDQADQPATVTWDGAMLTVALPAGSVVAPSSFAPASTGAPPAAVCVIDEDDSSVLNCTPAAGPSTEIDFATVEPVLLSSLTVPYIDGSGAGTLTLINTGPDIAPGGASVDATVSQGGSSLHGGGALRPLAGRGGLGVYLTLDDGQGDSRLFEGYLNEGRSGWSGSGQEESTDDSVWTDTWSAGGAPRQASSAPVGISASTGSNPPRSPPGPPPVSGTPLGRLPAGQAFSFLARPEASWTSPAAPVTVHWYFGDGSDADATIDEMVRHAYSAPGLYTVVAVVTDPAGVSGFGTGYAGVSGP